MFRAVRSLNGALDLISLAEAVESLRRDADPERARQMAAYHKAGRTYLGVANPTIDRLVRGWRSETRPGDWADLADGLWRTDIHEARVAAAKLVDRGRIDPDREVWDLIVSWVEDFDAWAIADHASLAGQKRVIADPRRIVEIEAWTRRDHMWSRRAALVITLPFAKDPAHNEIRDTVLGWAAAYVSDPEWFIQKAIGWWLRELSKHDPTAARVFLAEHGDSMKAFARREAAKYL